MARNLIDANRAIFGQLDNHCSARGTSLGNIGTPRWIASESKHRHFMINARVKECVHFSSSRKLARVELSSRSYLFSIGFEKNHRTFRNHDLILDPAFLTVGLSELQPRPSASPDEIREIVEWSDKNADGNYSGHDFEDIARLYPQVNVYDLSTDNGDAPWNCFFRACIDECELGSSWIEGSLAGALHSLCELDQNRIPYKVLCRSVFDHDKSSFFLALYRCLEALYSYSSADKLARALNITTPWGDVAAALEDSLGWHPREEGSLISIVKFASQPDLKTIVNCLDVHNPAKEGDLLVDQAAKAIYRLRNSIVHYRPAQHRIDMSDYNWEDICESMVGLVLDIYENVFSLTSTE